MNVTEEHIERFFQDKCNADEVEIIVAYLNDHPEIMEKYLGEEDWNGYSTSARLHAVVSEKMLSVIRQSTYSKGKSRLWVRYVAAAAILVMVAFGVKYLVNTNDAEKTNEIVNVPSVKVFPVLKVIKNNSKSKDKILLKDGSVVVLEPMSELSYYEPFESDKRRLYLKGKAQFKVVKDSSKPFTVYSNEISTTALGTEFKVTAFENQDIISVKLFEGKVVIRQADNNKKKWGKDYYLFPGDEFYFDRRAQSAKSVSNNQPKAVEKVNKKVEGKNDATNWFMFNNQNLAQVFDQLSAIYNVKIDYAAADLKNMNFIGKIEKTDSIETILNDIALLNNLSVVKNESGFSIRKK